MNQRDELENLSAFVDDELNHEQARFMLRRVGHYQQLKVSWQRYHIVGDSLRGEFSALADTDFAACVMQKIEASEDVFTEPTVTATTKHSLHRWLRWSAGGAIAAGVALATLVIIQPPVEPAVITSQVDNTPVVAKQMADIQPAADTHMMASPQVVDVPAWLRNRVSGEAMIEPATANFEPLSHYLRQKQSVTPRSGGSFLYRSGANRSRGTAQTQSRQEALRAASRHSTPVMIINVERR